jgi:hypothetical protein
VINQHARSAVKRLTPGVRLDLPPRSRTLPIAALPQRANARHLVLAVPRADFDQLVDRDHAPSRMPRTRPNRSGLIALKRWTNRACTASASRPDDMSSWASDSPATAWRAKPCHHDARAIRDIARVFERLVAARTDGAFAMFLFAADGPSNAKTDGLNVRSRQGDHVRADGVTGANVMVSAQRSTSAAASAFCSSPSNSF